MEVYKILSKPLTFKDVHYILSESPKLELSKEAVANIKKCREYLDEYAYRKIWSELSRQDREVVSACAMVPTGEISEIRNILGYDSNQFNPYRMRLIKAGIISDRTRGVVTFELPGFEDFVSDLHSLD